MCNVGSLKQLDIIYKKDGIYKMSKTSSLYSQLAEEQREERRGDGSVLYNGGAGSTGFETEKKEFMVMVMVIQGQVILAKLTRSTHSLYISV